MMMKNCSINMRELLLLIVGIALVTSNVAEAASRQAAPAPAVDCSSLTLTMADCLSFVTSGSTVSKPEGTCCSGLKSVLKTDAECLCEGFKNSAQLGIALNMTKALTLPAACHVSAPSVSDCGVNLNTDGSPAVSPTASPPSAAPAAPSTTGSSESADEAVAPAPAPGAGLGSSGSSAVAASAGSIALALVAACFS